MKTEDEESGDVAAEDAAIARRKQWEMVRAILLSMGVGAAILWIGFTTLVHNSGHHHGGTTRTKALIADVVNAVRSYKLEYNRFPVDSEADDGVTIDFDGGDGTTILRILMGENLALGSRKDANHREIVFIEPDTSTGVNLGVVMDGDMPMKLLDSWGQVIHIRMDSDYGKTIPNPLGGEPIQKGVIVWSDGDPRTEDGDAPWENDVTSWR